MREREAALDQAIRKVAALPGDTLVRLVYADSILPTVDFPKTDSPPASAG